MIKCHAYLIANAINIKPISNEKKLREVRLFKQETNYYAIFPYGAVICWGDGNLNPILSLLSPHLEDGFPESQYEVDHFEVKLGQKGSKLIFEDTIFLDSIDELEIIALSHAIAQSLRLSYFEDTILSSINQIMHIPQTLAKIGKIKESKKDISKLQGHLYLLKAKISFEHSILDKPEYFWEYPEHDHLYETTSRYLEVKPRIDILEKKIGTIDGILSLLSDELNHRHSSQLEWIIIILILIEVIFFFLIDIFKII